MSAIIIKSVNEVTNLDAINNRNAFAFVHMVKFDFINLRYVFQIRKEILVDDGQGGTITSTEVLKDEVGIVSANTLQTLWTAYNNDITAIENLNDEFRLFLANALRRKIANDGYFGLGLNDWEVIVG